MATFLVQEGYRQVQEFPIPEGESIVGRGAESDLVLASQGVSRRHLQVNCGADSVTVKDLNSRNGTFLNSVPIAGIAQLKHRDVLQLGDTMLVYNETENATQEGAQAGDERTFDLAYLKVIADAIHANIRKVVQGKDGVIRKVLVGLLSDGHVLIEDVPGVGKTMLAQSLAKSVRTEFKRIQFTPDLLPSDVTKPTVEPLEYRNPRLYPGVSPFTVTSPHPYRHVRV